MRLTISKVFSLSAYLILAGFAVSLLASSVALHRLEIGGPAYEKIVAGKDLVADILPPPAYVIESYLEAHLALREPKEVDAHLKRLQQLKSDYLARRDFWKKSELLPAELKALVARSHDEVQKFWRTVETSLPAALKSGDTVQISRAMAELSSSYNAHRAVVDEMVVKANEFSSHAEANAAFEAKLFLSLMFGLAALVFVSMWAVIRYLRRRSCEPLGALAAYLKQLTEGRYGESVPYTNNSDEIGEVARAVDLFRGALVEREQSRLRAEEDEKRHREERRFVEERAILTERELVSASIGAGLSELSSKNLAYRMERDLPESYGKLQLDFNAAIEQLENAVAVVKSGVGAIAPGAESIASAAEELSGQAQQQAEGLERASAALHEITESARHIAVGAGEANKIVGATRTEAEESGAVVRRAVDAINLIEKSSQSIGQIIAVVDEIAFQTNLLALNAGVEAARAGEAGRGFAVVASEVRALAQRSAEAAKEIKTLISASSTEVAEGVELVGLAGTALQKIGAHVFNLERAVSDIAASAREQAASLTDVNSVVSQIDRNTQKNAQMAEEMTVASRALQEETSNLALTVRDFRLTQDGLAPVREVAARPAAAPVVAMKSVGRGGAALAPRHDEWEEF
ncbi:methyl-accepting chemotaxis protein [Methylocystis sp. MJC1]|jgi:methyl-accepting chemotaxis protein|uniref:methyl-accepting chemotaxis protein n=1 Tax=Methylocystis sp. MJC1 TaxID=2654282 RepID=UPI0013EC91B2|nr:methyl-accepting chemotaxis protein [Methylocystis sp. MJC1]KAF2990177.1 Methyl-accepting chemotaxis protein II [Methylocystis sp. MJC1]MBU6527572.1 HAMP domain-containing protein [Methylocystis sp. MJC1]UZX10511.1 methyl-accepting chemotaxis protein [Methylocystis sp. MJC1]